MKCQCGEHRIKRVGDWGDTRLDQETCVETSVYACVKCGKTFKLQALHTTGSQTFTRMELENIIAIMDRHLGK